MTDPDRTALSTIAPAVDVERALGSIVAEYHRRERVRRLSVGGAAMVLGVAGIAAAVHAAQPSHDVPVSATGTTVPNEGSGAASIGTGCSVTAVRSPAELAANGGDHNDPAAKLPTGPSMSESEAIALARKRAAEYGSPEAPPSAPVKTDEVAYEVAVNQNFTGLRPEIAPSRCVWIVTVHAPAATKGAPGGGSEVKDVYSVIFDVGSHASIGVVFGMGLP